MEEDHDGTESLRSIFRLVDTDNDGLISFNELGDAVSHVIGRVLGGGELDQLKMAFGGDGKGAQQISLDTFTSVMQQFTGGDAMSDEEDEDEDGDSFRETRMPVTSRGRARSRQMSNFSTDDLGSFQV